MDERLRQSDTGVVNGLIAAIIFRDFRPGATLPRRMALRTHSGSDAKDGEA
jgi:hypothetical protein